MGKSGGKSKVLSVKIKQPSKKVYDDSETGKVVKLIRMIMMSL